jgi:hypothetical protein
VALAEAPQDYRSHALCDGFPVLRPLGFIGGPSGTREAADEQVGADEEEDVKGARPRPLARVQKRQPRVGDQLSSSVASAWP